MHYPNSNLMHEGKVRYKLYKNASYCSEQILETTALRLLNSDLTNHPKKTKIQGTGGQLEKRS